MVAVSLEFGGVTDWPWLQRLMTDRRELIALTSCEDAKEKLISSRVLVVPWLETDKVYLCTAEGAENIIKASAACLRAWVDEQEKEVDSGS